MKQKGILAAVILALTTGAAYAAPVVETTNGNTLGPWIATGLGAIALLVIVSGSAAGWMGGSERDKPRRYRLRSR